MFDQLKNMKDLASLMGNLGGLKEKMEQAQAELATKTVEAESGAGAVRVTMNGKFEVVDVTIDPVMITTLAGTGTDADRQMVEELIASAMNAAVLKVQELLKDTLGEATGGLNLPGMPGM
jgi:hypothetical protein